MPDLAGTLLSGSQPVHARAVILENPPSWGPRETPVTAAPVRPSSLAAAPHGHHCLYEAHGCSLLPSPAHRVGARKRHGRAGARARLRRMTPAGRRAVTIVAWPALPSRGCKGHRALEGLERWMPCLRAAASREPMYACASPEDNGAPFIDNEGDDLRDSAGCHGRTVRPSAGRTGEYGSTAAQHLRADNRAARGGGLSTAAQTSAPKARGRRRSRSDDVCRTGTQCQLG